jgi:hypothetical protein
MTTEDRRQQGQNPRTSELRILRASAKKTGTWNAKPARGAATWNLSQFMGGTLELKPACGVNCELTIPVSVVTIPRHCATSLSPSLKTLKASSRDRPNHRVKSKD